MTQDEGFVRSYLSSPNLNITRDEGISLIPDTKSCILLFVTDIVTIIVSISLLHRAYSNEMYP